MTSAHLARQEPVDALRTLSLSVTRGGPVVWVSVAAALLVTLSTAAAYAEPGYLKPARRAQQFNWHGQYSHAAYGGPVALVVPPTAQLQTSWSWGAPSTHVRRIDHQFGRDYVGPGGASFRPTPRWPRCTDQFGVYYVRGPWYPTQP